MFDNGFGSYKPYWPAPACEELLRCNLPEVPGKFSIRVMRGSFGANQTTLDAYCDVRRGLDEIPEAGECKRSLVFVAAQPEVHKCCGQAGSGDGVHDKRTCEWKWAARVDKRCVEVPGHCCQEKAVSQPGEWSEKVAGETRTLRLITIPSCQVCRVTKSFPGSCRFFFRQCRGM